MKNGIIKETKNSRLIKADIPATYEEFKTLLANSGLPIDLLFNADGWSTLPTVLSRGSLLSAQSEIQVFGQDGDHTVDEAISAVSQWRLIDKLDNTVAMSGEWEAPDVYGDGKPYDIGAYMIGGGGGGGRASNTYAAASGGASGYAKNFIIKAVVPGTKISYVIGSGGGPQTAGGSTAFNSVTVQGGQAGTGKSASSSGCVAKGAFGGQGSDAVDDFGATETNQNRRTVSLYGGVSPAETVGRPTSSGTSTNYGISYSQSPRESQNAFDTEMVTLCAGGWATKYSSRTFKQTINAMPDGTKGGNGGGGNATGYGNGGGANISGYAGSGSDGVIFIYARRHIE